MEIISSELKNLRSSGGGGCAPGSNRSRWGRREKSDAGHQCEGAEFKALDNNITPYCNTNITRLDINRYFITDVRDPRTETGQTRAEKF